MPKRSSNGVLTEAQVKAAIKRGDAAITEIESSLSEVRELSQQLNEARNIMQDRLGVLLHGAPPQMASQGGPIPRIPR